MTNRPDPGPIFQLATGYWSSALLLEACDLGVFGALASGPKTATEVAACLNTAPRATGMLLNACVGLGLLDRVGDALALSPTAQAFLVPGSPGYLGSALRWSRDQYEAWGRLREAVRSGGPVVRPEEHLGDDPDQTRAFVMGMHERAVGVARGVVGHLGLEGASRMLDVGGGPGTYSVLAAQTYPDLRCTVLDLPGVVAVAAELVSRSGVADRVGVIAGDARSGEYGADAYDAVLFSGVLHQMAPATIARMFAGAMEALQPGGTVVVSDMMLDETRTEPLFSALFSLQMLLTSAEGAVFSVSECVAWLGEAGFEDVAVSPLPPPLPYTVVRARKPAVS